MFENSNNAFGPRRLLFVSLQLSPSPMMIFAVGIEQPFDMAV